MDKKTKYTLPMLTAVLALALVAAAPSAIAGSYSDDKMRDDSAHKSKKLVIEGFVGQLQITEDTDKAALKEMVTVSLSEAAVGLDVIKGELKVIANEDNEKFLVWKLKSVEKDPESETKTKTIHIVDAADADNTATITKEYDYMKDKDTMKTNETKTKMSSNETKTKMSSDETNTNTMTPNQQGSTTLTATDSDDLRSQFVDKIQELQAAISSGDSESVLQIRQQLSDLKNAILQSIAT